jgi:hypothetical protein
MIKEGLAGRTDIVTVGVEAEIEGTPDQRFIDPWKALLADKQKIVKLLFVLGVCHSIRRQESLGKI